jgi:signal transduction histidine kinase
MIDLLISDDGDGISEKDLEKIFKPFYSTWEKDLQGDRHGMGIGLWLAWHQLDQMEGQIVVDSVLGQGTTFTISLKQS